MHAEERLYRSLKQAILEQRLPPGMRLRELRLAELFGVKRGQVRTVLTRLAQDRLIQHQPHAGARVAKPDPQLLRQLFEARRLLESALMPLLVERIDVEGLQRLRDLLEQEQQAYRQGRRSEGLRLSVAFHAALAGLAGNPVLQETIEELIGRTPLVLLDDDPATSPCVNHDHRAIVTALEQRDAATAQRRMEEHLAHLEQRLNEQGSPKSPEPDRLLREIADGR